MSQPSSALRARFVFPLSGPPIADGLVVVDGSRIAAVADNLSVGSVDDLGNVAILPGLVNAHTHLEFSNLPQPLGSPGMSLPQWLRGVMEHRQTAGHAAERAVARGLAECIAAGTTAVGEIAATDWRTADYLPQNMPTTVMFHESIGPTLMRAREAAAAAKAFLAAKRPRADVLPALSPHAPYTVHPHLLSSLVELSRRYRVPLAMHLAETREELELLHLSSGPFRELLESLDAWDPADDARLASIVDYLAQLARAPRALVIHGNYLDGEEIEFLSAHRQTMSVVYCPRSHHFFAHEPYPLARLLAAGVSMALGTDSRASNPDLSIFEEMRFVAAHHPQVDPATVLRLGTIGGAAALALDDRMGTLEPGKAANLAIVALGDDSPADPHELLFAPESRIVGTYVGGQASGVGGQ
ncbi:MAG: amidohydrolase family protein [Pirellulales bacterium]